MDNLAAAGNLLIWKYRLEHDIMPMLPQRIIAVLRKAELSSLDSLEEIRMRAGKPLVLQNYKSEWFVGNDGALNSSPNSPFIVSQLEIQKTIEMMSDNSIYAYQDEIRSGYITLRGGHRVGLTGKVVMDGGSIRNIRDASSINIRLTGEVRGCSDKVLKHIITKSGNINNTLIISPPQCGKTTILRDIARAISDGYPETGFKGVKVGIVDERSEIASCFRGVPQNDVGLRTDVLDGCPKTLGMIMLVRSMSPRVIITDEIGNEGDREAIQKVLNAGVKIITTAHGYNISELKSRREVLSLLEGRVFERLIVLNSSKGPGTVAEVVDGVTMKLLEG